MAEVDYNNKELMSEILGYKIDRELTDPEKNAANKIFNYAKEKGISFAESKAQIQLASFLNRREQKKIENLRELLDYEVNGSLKDLERVYVERVNEYAQEHGIAFEEAETDFGIKAFLRWHWSKYNDDYDAPKMYRSKDGRLFKPEKEDDEYSIVDVLTGDIIKLDQDGELIKIQAERIDNNIK